jgi:Uma2 family endonuclease
MSELPVSYLSVEDYLSLDRDSETAIEYMDGMVYAMAGGSPNHALIAMNLARELGGHVKGKCRVFSSDLRVGYASRMYVHPDLTLVCQTPVYDDESGDTLINPLLVVEVLSPSTESRDRGRKLFHYLQIESLTDYLLVSQDEPRIELYHRKPDGEWVYLNVYGREERIEIPSIGFHLSLTDVYDFVEFGVAMDQPPL